MDHIQAEISPTLRANSLVGLYDSTTGPLWPMSFYSADEFCSYRTRLMVSYLLFVVTDNFCFDVVCPLFVVCLSFCLSDHMSVCLFLIFVLLLLFVLSTVFELRQVKHVQSYKYSNHRGRWIHKLFVYKYITSSSNHCTVIDINIINTQKAAIGSMKGWGSQ